MIATTFVQYLVDLFLFTFLNIFLKQHSLSHLTENQSPKQHKLVNFNFNFNFNFIHSLSIYNYTIASTRV